MDEQSSSRALRRIPAAEARALLEEHEGSGMTLAAFARDRGVKPWTLYNARARARRKQQRATEQSFAAVTVIAAGEQSAPSIEMVLPSGLVLRVQDGFDEVTLRRLLGVVAGC